MALTRAGLLADPNLGPILKAMDAPARDAMVASLIHASGGDAGATTTQRTRTRRAMGVPQQRFRLWNAYYSVVRFQAQVAVAGGVSTLSWNQGMEQRPFSYRIGDQLTGAGFDPSFTPQIATQADTNLVQASQTNAGEQLLVHGISLMPGTTTDAGAFAWLNDSMSVVVSMDGDSRRYRLGRPIMIPASGGMYGFATSVATSFNTGQYSNGMPEIMNFYPFPEPLVWTSAGETDSNLNVILKLERPVVLTNASPPGPTAVNQFGSYVDFVARLHTEQSAERSVNQ
jgi:hypothetical protein